MSLLGAGPSALEGQGKGCTWVETEELTLGGLSVLMEHKAVSFGGSSKGHSKGGGGVMLATYSQMVQEKNMYIKQNKCGKMLTTGVLEFSVLILQFSCKFEIISKKGALKQKVGPAL